MVNFETETGKSRGVGILVSANKERCGSVDTTDLSVLGEQVMAHQTKIVPIPNEGGCYDICIIPDIPTHPIVDIIA